MNERLLDEPATPVVSTRRGPARGAGPWRRRSLRAAAVMVALFLGGCLPIPNLQSELNVAPPSYRVPLDQVSTEYVVRDAPPAPRTPVEMNRVGYLRYGADEHPDTVLLFVPGIFGGAASFDALARQLVASTPGLEVWALDRRSNFLEDRSAIRESLRAGDPMIAFDYYIERWGRDDGFTPLPFEQASMLRHWGLEVHLRDLHRVVLDARERAPRIVLGGHSLGASLVSLYAAYRVVAGVDPRYGQEYIDALVLLDGALGRTGAFARADLGYGVGPLRLAPSVEDLEAGRGAPYSHTLVSPRYQVEREVIALLAQLSPEADAPGGLSDVPMSNRALAGVRNDDEYGPVPIFNASLGEAQGADFDGNLTAVILGGLEGVRSKSVAGVAEGAPRVTWSPGDPERERTDLDSFLRSWTLPQTNFTEWYFPLRLALDMTLLDPSLEGMARFIPNRHVTVPTLSLGAGRGLIASMEGMRPYADLRYGSPISAHVLPGLTHMDVVTARSNPAVPILQRWIAYFTARSTPQDSP